MATTLEQALGSANAQKYLRMVAQAEGTYKDATGDPYGVAFGGGAFDYSKGHPGTLREFTQTDGKKNRTSAHGAYQFLKPTWDGLQRDLGLPDFGPRSQDLAALELIRRAGALDDVLAGNFDKAVAKTGATWASLPSSPYAQPRRDAGFVEKALTAATPSAQAGENPFADLIPAQKPAAASAPGARAAAPMAADENPFADLIPKATSKAATKPVSSIEALGAGLGAGVGQVALGAQHYLGAGLSALGADSAGQWLKNDAAQGKRKLAGEIAPYQDSNPLATGAGEVGGNILATLPVGGLLGKGVAAAGSRIAPQAAQKLGQALSSGGSARGLSIGARVAGGAGTGAATGALLDTQNPGQAAALGAVVGGAVPAAMAGVQRVIAPKASTNEALQLLRKEGVSPTLGQALGGNANRLEEKLVSVPVLGDAVRGAREKATEQFNKAALNRALKPIGSSVDKIGREGVDEVASKLGQAYDDLLPKLLFKADDTFSMDLQRLQGMATDMEPAQAQQFAKILRDKVVGKLSPAGGMTGQTFKQLESDLGTLAKNYSGSAMASEKQLGGALLELQATMRSALERSNPQQSKQLKAINEGYANYARLRQAASMVGAEDGIFTANQLTSAVKATDKSTGKGNFARGKSLMQDLADAGKNVLGNKVPNSGTADRLWTGGAVLASGAVNPAIPLSVLGGSLAYTPQLQRALVNAVASRPQSAQAVSEGFRKGASVLIPGAVPLGLYQSRQP